MDMARDLSTVCRWKLLKACPYWWLLHHLRFWESANQHRRARQASNAFWLPGTVSTYSSLVCCASNTMNTMKVRNPPKTWFDLRYDTVSEQDHSEDATENMTVRFGQRALISFLKPSLVAQDDDKWQKHPITSDASWSQFAYTAGQIRTILRLSFNKIPIDHLPNTQRMVHLFYCTIKTYKNQANVGK